MKAHRLLAISVTAVVLIGVARAQDKPVKPAPDDGVPGAGEAKDATAEVLFASARTPPRSGRAMPQASSSQQLQGVWRASRGEVKNVLYNLTFNGNTLTAHHVKSGRAVGGGTYQLDLTSGTVDVQGTSGQYAGNIYRGRVAVNGNTMLWAMGDAGQPRPAKVAHDPGSNSYLVILQPKQ